MAKDKYYGKTLRKNFARHEEVVSLPNLLEIQKDSYRWFLDTGLQEVFKDVDITAASQEVVYNPADGYYHLNSINGPVVYLRFSNSPYINLSDIVANQRVGAYLYDTNGEYLKKEQYNSYLQQYYYVPNPMYDPTGKPVNMLDAQLVYPLNDDLLYILQTFAKHQQWENPDSPNYLFKDTDGNIIPGINNDLAWMFPLCYAE